MNGDDVQRYLNTFINKDNQSLFYSLLGLSPDVYNSLIESLVLHLVSIESLYHIESINDKTITAFLKDNTLSYSYILHSNDYMESMGKISNSLLYDYGLLEVTQKNINELNKHISVNPFIGSLSIATVNTTYGFYNTARDADLAFGNILSPMLVKYQVNDIHDLFTKIPVTDPIIDNAVNGILIELDNIHRNTSPLSMFTQSNTWIHNYTYSQSMLHLMQTLYIEEKIIKHQTQHLSLLLYNDGSEAFTKATIDKLFDELINIDYSGNYMTAYYYALMLCKVLVSSNLLSDANNKLVEEINLELNNIMTRLHKIKDFMYETRSLIIRDMKVSYT